MVYNLYQYQTGFQVSRNIFILLDPPAKWILPHSFRTAISSTILPKRNIFEYILLQIQIAFGTTSKR